MLWLVCLFRRHDWHGEYNYATRRTTWTCRRCGAHKITADGVLNVGDSGGPGPGSPRHITLRLPRKLDEGQQHRQWVLPTAVQHP
jgi:hypothetical protein